MIRSQREDSCFVISLLPLLIYFYNFLLIFSAGGLVTAVAPVVIRGNGLWGGWPGIQLTSEEEPIPESDPNDQTPTAGLKSNQV